MSPCPFRTNIGPLTASDFGVASIAMLMGMESPIPAERLMTPTGRASVGRSYSSARARERVHYGWDTHFNDDRALGDGIVLVSHCLPM